MPDPGQGRAGRPDRAPAREPALTQQPERRFEPRRPSHSRALIVAPAVELACLIVDRSPRGMKIRMDRALSLPARVIIVDVEQAAAIEAEVVWSKGTEVGLKEGARASLRGLVPSRLAAARAAWMRAGGR
ncbi:PilZ domain-containing protein [Brevundimonas sp.]|uniref:PilZ domain-containing protein n=1 Tax=Brevundimonas sp. TaxID=1871086 RepID=UPI0035B1E395